MQAPHTPHALLTVQCWEGRSNKGSTYGWRICRESWVRGENSTGGVSVQTCTFFNDLSYRDPWPHGDPEVQVAVAGIDPVLSGDTRGWHALVEEQELEPVEIPVVHGEVVGEFPGLIMDNRCGEGVEGLVSIDR